MLGHGGSLSEGLKQRLHGAKGPNRTSAHEQRKVPDGRTALCLEDFRRGSARKRREAPKMNQQKRIASERTKSLGAWGVGWVGRGTVVARGIRGRSALTTKGR